MENIQKVMPLLIGYINKINQNIEIANICAKNIDEKTEGISVAQDNVEYMSEALNFLISELGKLQIIEVIGGD